MLGQCRMVEERLERCARLVGETGIERLRRSRVAVFGLGGVGSYCAEALARSGVGWLRVVDHDVVSRSNMNRQLVATSATLGQGKAEAARARLQEVAPGIVVDARSDFFCAETAETLLDGGLDVVVDAIDSLGPKVELVAQCRERSLLVVSSLGAAARLDPTAIRVVPMAKTRGDPLGVQVRKRLRRRGGLDGVMAAYSEEPRRPSAPGVWTPTTTDLCRGRQRLIQPSAVMVPAAMGMTIAAYVVAHLAKVPFRHVESGSPSH